MNIKRELIALAIRALSEKTNLVRKPDPFEDLLSTIFGGETREERLARELDESSQRAIEAAKRLNTNRKFKKITKNI